MNNHQKEIFFKAVDEKRKTDLLIGAKLGAQEVLQRFINGMNEEGKGVHIDSLLCILGSLGGYSCQQAVREQAPCRISIFNLEFNSVGRK